jgi:Spy/CpxP family protein refolding chaperone
MADTPDTAKIEQLKASINEAEAAALNERVDLQLRIAQVLSPEQRQKAREVPAGPNGRGAF